MVSELHRMAVTYRTWLKDGLDVKEKREQDGSTTPALKATGQEIRLAVGDNIAIVENVLDYILDGKSNKVAPKKNR